MHGTYDFLVSMEEEVVGEALLIWALLAWFALVIVEFIVALCLVNSTSKTDAYFVAPVTDERTLGDGV